MIGARNVRWGLILLPIGLLAGMAMSLYAFEPGAGYGDLPRRLVRLAHIAAVMLPLINVILGPWIDRVTLGDGWRRAASWMLLLGAVGLPAALAGAAAWAPNLAVALSTLPAAFFTAGTLLLAAGSRGVDQTCSR